MIYFYRVELGKATLRKMYLDGQDCGQKPKNIGTFSSNEDAKRACIKHHEKACTMARAAGRVEPTIMFD